MVRPTRLRHRRYGNYGTPIDAGDAPIEFEAYVSLSHLQAAMLALNTALVSAVAEIRRAVTDPYHD
ncbi:MAG: hypothetical protein AB1508_14065 [Pseudomonadota bacterium]|jgi:hypothetical protein